MDKLHIQNEMRNFDLKKRDFYDSLDEEEKKKFSPYLMLRWGATVEGIADLQEWYLRAVNERLNKHYFDISAKEHKKLLWLLATTVSPGMGAQRHSWQGNKKKEGESNNKAVKFLAKLYPHLKQNDIELLAELNESRSDLKDLARQHGWSDDQIKSEL